MNKLATKANLLSCIALCVFASGTTANGATIRFIAPDFSPKSSTARSNSSIVQSFLIPLEGRDSASRLRFAIFGDNVIGQTDQSGDPAKATSDDTAQYSRVRPYLNMNAQPIVVAGEVVIENSRFAEIIATPEWTDSIGQIHQIDSVAVLLGDRPIAQVDLLNRTEVLTAESRQVQSSAAGGSEFVIIANEHLSTAFETLRQYRNSRGVPTSVVKIEEIIAGFSGRDDAERLRNYLKTFYASGGRYVLLGGDAQVLPVRYAYPYPTDSAVDHREQLLCDLYFADLTGEWDVDSDNIWGERYEDLPDATPELLVGRLPISSPEEVAAYTNKLIRYETNPGSGDPSYLTRTLFYSADQMRDYGPGGQHRTIAQVFPSPFQVDTSIGVETPSGNDPNPTNLGPLQMPSATRTGYGIVNVIAHGRFDGFVFKSSGYNEFPKQYILTGGYSEVQCAFDSLGNDALPSFYYSLACDNAGWDLDRPPFSTEGTNMGRELIGSSSGAVAMIGNTRWGWIGSSFLLHKAFFDSLFAHPDQPAILAMYRAQQTYWYYRDLVYGQVFLGDPLTKIYTSLPRLLTVNATAEGGAFTATVTSPTGPESGVEIILSDSNGVIETQLSSSDGSVTFDSDLSLGQTYSVTAAGENTTVGIATLTPSIVLGVDDDEYSVPSQYALNQNYPNPFNPSTEISFDLPKSAHVTLVIFNMLGQEVAHLIEKSLVAGSHRVTWHGYDEHGSSCASGVYLYRLTADNFSATRKLVLVR